MNRRNNQMDDVMCVVCDLWWLWLTIFILGIAAILTRNSWLPLLGFDQPAVAEPLPPTTAPVATAIPPQATSRVATPSATPITLSSTSTNKVVPTTSDSVVAGAQAPDFTLPCLDGSTISLSDQHGKPVLLIFFASFDSYSQAEAPTLHQIAQNYGDRLIILPIDIAYNDRIEDVKRFVSDYDWMVPVALDETGSVMELYGQNSVPSHIFINSNGIIVAIEGTLTAEQLEEHILGLMD